MDGIVPLLEQVKVVTNEIGSGDFIESFRCLFVSGSHSLVVFFVFGLVPRNVGVFVDDVLDLPGSKVDFKDQVVLLFLKYVGIKGRILDDLEGFNDTVSDTRSSVVHVQCDSRAAKDIFHHASANLSDRRYSLRRP